MPYGSEDEAGRRLGIGVFVERWSLDEGTCFDAHSHDVHQLVWASSGVVAVQIDDRTWVLPPSMGLWVPAHVKHTTAVTRPAAMHGIYLRRAVCPDTCADTCPGTWSEPVVVAMSPIVRELVGLLIDLGLPPTIRKPAEGLLVELLRPVSVASIYLPLPRDPRAHEVALGILDDPASQLGLREWGRRVGASDRTLARLFVTETGFTFGRWRTTARLQLALTGLAEGCPTSAVARQVGYSSASAFVGAFRRATGETPGRFFGRQATEAEPVS